MRKVEHKQSAALANTSSGLIAIGACRGLDENVRLLPGRFFGKELFAPDLSNIMTSAACRCRRVQSSREKPVSQCYFG